MGGVITGFILLIIKYVFICKIKGKSRCLPKSDTFNIVKT